jgi:hypothetical protein
MRRVRIGGEERKGTEIRNLFGVRREATGASENKTINQTIECLLCDKRPLEC